MYPRSGDRERRRLREGGGGDPEPGISKSRYEDLSRRLLGDGDRGMAAVGRDVGAMDAVTVAWRPFDFLATLPLLPLQLFVSEKYNPNVD